MKLENKTVLVTGGTSGIGLGIAEAFLSAKSTVIVCGRDKHKLATVKDQHPDIKVMTCDVSEARQREALAAEVLRRFPELDILVNNAGIQRYIDLKKGYAELKNGEDEIAINFTATVEMTALFVGQLMKRPAAAIFNVSSGLAFMPMLNTPIYNATKAAIHTYSLVLREQLKGTPVKVIELAPPMVDTSLNKVGREALNLKYRGISLGEYLPTVIQGLQDDNELILEKGQDILAEPRGVTEKRLLKPSR
jgi:uncharacterized oxidoreductase